MTMLKALGRTVGLTAVRCLCSKYGPTSVLVGTFALGGSAILYLDQPAGHAVARTPAAHILHAPSCGPLSTGYLAETNQFYCIPNGN
jgi:hypothetical protein